MISKTRTERRVSLISLPSMVKPWLLVLPSLVLLPIHDAHANHINATNHWFKDYLDFAQNKGIFKRGATNLVLIRQDGTELALPNVPFPDFSVVTNQGSSTSIGGAYMVTATHNKKYGPWHGSVAKPAFGKTTYQTLDSKPEDHVEAGQDFSVVRLNKFVVETTGVPRGIDTTLTEKEFIDRYGVEYNGKKQVVAYRAGSGVLSVTWRNGRVNYPSISYKPELLSGSLFTYFRNYKTNLIAFKNFTSFNNELSQGDSGSGLIVWDNKNKEWVMAGALNGIAYGNVSGTFFQYATWNQKAVDTLKDRFTHKIALDGGNLTFDGKDKNQYQIGSGAAEKFADRKDLSFTGGGNITLNQNLNLGVGGLIFDENHTYTVNGEYTFTDKDKNVITAKSSYKGAGVDIGKGTTVNWNIKGDASDDLHKIGEGTLDVKIAQGNKLKVGNGTVILRDTKTFENIYMANGKATIKLEHADALNKDEKMSGIYFARYGGTLDINGHSQTFKRIGASDDGAIVTNSSSTMADINFAVPWKYAYHGQFTGNLNVNHKYDSEADSAAKDKDRHLVLDGGADIKGEFNVKNAKLTMQGLPTTHAWFGSPSCSFLGCEQNWPGEFYNKENGINSQLGTHYKTSNEKNSFDQPDWETRTYKFKNLNVENSEVAVGRNTYLHTDINAKNSSITFGGNATIYRDRHAGDNVTGFDFRQDLKEGKSDQNGTIYYEGHIDAEKSNITSSIPLMAASFDLKDGSKFESTDKNSVTRILDKGIKVEDKSTLVLGNIVVQDTNQPITITKSDDSVVSVENVEARGAAIQLPGDVVNGKLIAYKDGSITVDKWVLNNSNLATNDNGIINIANLETYGQQVADANISISDHLYMGDVNPKSNHNGSSEWIGLSVNTLTLQQNAEVKAQISNDYMSLRNLEFNKDHTLVKALTLNDYRKNKDIIFDLQGNDVNVISQIKDNTILFSFTTDTPHPNPDDQSKPNPDNGPGAGSGSGSKPLPDALNTPVGQAFLTSGLYPNGKDIIISVLEHNYQGGLAYQEVAIKDALSMDNIEAGVQALNNIVIRTESMYDKTAKVIRNETMVKPIKNVVDARLAALRRSIRRQVNYYQPVASVVHSPIFSKSQKESFLNQSLYIDVGVGYEKDDGLKEHVISSNLGYDRVLRIDNKRMVLGGTFSVTKLDRDDNGAKDDAIMHSLTGYLSLEQKEGFELQSYLTAGYMTNERTFMPEISIGEQKFDEDSWLLMSSNYFKYHFREGQFSIKPMIIADLGWTRTSSSESDYLKRDSLTDITLDLGLGLEVEGSQDSIGYLFQVTATRNVWSSADEIGINLKNADGYISYGLGKRDDIRFAGNMMITKHFNHGITMDLGTGVSATDKGALGVNANARLRWSF